MNLSTSLSALRTGWYLLLIGVVVASAAAVAIEHTADPFYEANASYVLSPSAGIDSDDIARGVDSLDTSRSRSIMTTLTEIAASDAVLSEAFVTLGFDPRQAESYSVDSIVVPEANVIEIVVTGPDPETTATLASTIGEIGGLRFVEFYQIYDIDALDPATVPTEPANPGLEQLLAIGIALGLIAGTGAALLRSAWLGRSGRTMSSRLEAYGTTVTPIEEHGRYKRVG